MPDVEDDELAAQVARVLAVRDRLKAWVRATWMPDFNAPMPTKRLTRSQFAEIAAIRLDSERVIETIPKHLASVHELRDAVDFLVAGASLLSPFLRDLAPEGMAW